MLSDELRVETSGPRSKAFEQAVCWERAAKILDLDRSLMRKLRSPEIEWVSHHQCASRLASLYGAMSQRRNGTVATLLVGNAVNAGQIAEEACELQLELALAAMNEGGAAIGLLIPSAGVLEGDLFELARECAPVVSRVLGEVRLMPIDTRATGFANWLASVASSYGARVLAPNVAPETYLANRVRREARVIAHLSRLAREEIGKKPTRVTIIGLDAVGRECLHAMQELDAIIVAVADESGGLVDEAGMEITPLLEHIEGGGLAAEYSGAEHITHAEALAMHADILLLNGSSLEITESNSRSVMSPVVVEGAANSLSLGAKEELSARGAMVVPHALIRSCGLRGVADLHGVGQAWMELKQVCARYKCAAPAGALVLSVQRLAERERIARP